MASVIIGSPSIGPAPGTPQQFDAPERYVGVGLVRATAPALGAGGPLAGIPRDAGLIVQQGYTDSPTYVVSFNVAATVAMDIFSVQLGAAFTNRATRLRRIVLVNPGAATAAALVDLVLGTANGIGSGGTVPNALAVDRATRAAGCTGGPDPATIVSAVHVGDTTQAAGVTALYSPLVTVSVPAAAGGFNPLVIYDASDPRVKPVTSYGGGNGSVIVLQTPAVGAGAAGLRGYVEFTVENA